MQLQDAITSRRMARRTDGTALPVDEVRAMLDLARRAPTAGHAQGVDLVLVTDPDRRRALADLAGEQEYVERGYPAWLSTAPVHVVACADVRRYRERYAAPDKQGAGVDGWGVPYWWMDLGAAVQNLLLLAAERGWAAGFLGEHAVPGLAELLGLPDDVHAAGIVTLGHPHPEGAPTTTSERRPRRTLEDVVHVDGW